MVRIGRMSIKSEYKDGLRALSLPFDIQACPCLQRQVPVNCFAFRLDREAVCRFYGVLSIWLVCTMHPALIFLLSISSSTDLLLG